MLQLISGGLIWLRLGVDCGALSFLGCLTLFAGYLWIVVCLVLVTTVGLLFGCLVGFCCMRYAGNCCNFVFWGGFWLT